MGLFDRSFEITPVQYEQIVRAWLVSAGGNLSEFSATHREKLCGNDGEYEIDVVVRFQALNTPFLVLAECKRHRFPIERETVQILHDRVRSLGAHKGLVFSTSKFQSGAVDYAEHHGIALIQLLDSEALIMGRSGEPKTGEPLFPSRPDFFGMLNTLTADGKRRYSSIYPSDVSPLRHALGLHAI